MKLVKYADSCFLIDVYIVDQLDQLAQAHKHPKRRVLRDVLCEALRIPPCQGVEFSNGRQGGVRRTQKQIDAALEKKAAELGITKQRAMRKVLREYFEGVT